MKAKASVYILLCVLGVLALTPMVVSCGGGVCTAGASQACKCGDKNGTQVCKADGTAYEACKCDGSSSEKTGESTGTQETTAEITSETVTEPAAEITPEPALEPALEPVSEPGPEPTPEPDAGSDDQSQEQTPEVNVDVSCAADSFAWQGKCYTKEAFCTGTTSNSSFPIFSKDAIAVMKTPYEIEVDVATGRPMFCQTQDGYYYLNGSGYGPCDLDKDGWINIEAYRAVTSTDAQIRRNARCNLKKIEAIVYHQEGNSTAQVQTLSNTAYLVETARNDGGKDVIELPVYTENQAVLPKTTGSSCTKDTDCGGNSEVCYRGNCLVGRRFQPSEINTLTKACISGIDLNDNQLDDSSESPSDSPTPSSEFKPLLNAGYFMELHYGYHDASYSHNGKTIEVFHIHERPRSDPKANRALALKCQEATDGFDPDYWRKCTVKDDQQCEDPNNPGTLKSGLSNCWLKDVQRSIPSLFKCVIHDNTTDKNTTAGYFHPDNYGFAKNYNRTRCKVKHILYSTDPKIQLHDLQFECTADDGKRTPDPSKKEVGWACVSFRSYAKSADYLAGCVDQKAEQACGTSKDGKTVTYLQLETDSYGMVRAKVECGNSNGKGECDFAQRVCSGGTWLDCNKCDHCPQDTSGAKKTCPNGTWPSDSCKLLKAPATEICDGKDNDCDGQIDERLSKETYYHDNDNDSYPNKNKTEQACKGLQSAGYIAKRSDNKWDCDDNEKDINPGAKEVCDGIDNNCSGTVDDTSQVTWYTYYEDDDGDSYGNSKSTKSFKACVKKGDASTLCKGKNDCISISYQNNGETRNYTKDSTDCCDTDANAKPGQTTYFATANKCGDFDYNCDGKNTKDVTACQCSTQVRYKEVGKAQCGYVEGSGWDPKTWRSESCTHSGCLSKNTGSCELAATYSFAATSDFTLTYECTCSNFTCSASEKKCTKVATVDKSKVSVSWTPKASDGSTLLVFKNSNYSKGCVFNKDGTVPGCGETGYVAGSTESAPSQPTTTKGNTKFNSGSHQCAPSCWTCGNCSAKSYYCSFSWALTIDPSNEYKFIKQTTTQQQVKCR